VRDDPKFAMAYAHIANAHANLGESRLALEYVRKAYELRENVSERERLYIEAHYYGFATGELEKSAQVWELYQQIYPKELPVTKT
jgi:SLT domain-containing protein